MRKGAPLRLFVGISENGYHVSNNRTLNCEWVAPSHIKDCHIAMGYRPPSHLHDLLLPRDISYSGTFFVKSL